MAASPLMATADDRAREAALPQLQALDELVSAHGVLLGLGPLLSADRPEPHLPAWAAGLARTTKSLSFTVAVASPQQGVAPHAATVAAQTMAAVAHATPNGMGNFRFAAAANVPPGTPFFPVASHQGPGSIAVGLESASLVEDVFGRKGDSADPTTRLRDRLDEALAPVARTAADFARREGQVYLGIDPSPAPRLDRSIGAAIEAFTGVPFGSASTLDACAAVTASLKSLRGRTCEAGPAGMPGSCCRCWRTRCSRSAPPKAAKESRTCCCTRASAGPGSTWCRYRVTPRSRCWPDRPGRGDALGEAAEAAVGAAVPAPRQGRGELASFDDPYLTDCAVMEVP